ncbi:MAG: sigma-70 family RNA polymerase sigma factor [Butyrivibrio sp.]|nr:sigma-70 family RNA polymerase sigma factor [Butyrivibrio sp.]
MQNNYEQIYSTYNEKVMNYIRSRVYNIQDAEDIHADVFEKVMLKMDDFDSSKASISTWIYTITHNKVIDFYRVHHESMPLNMEVLGDELAYDGNISDGNVELLADALETLSEKDKSIIVLYYYCNYTLKEIAQKMNISYNSCKQHHKIALSNLRENLIEKHIAI